MWYKIIKTAKIYSGVLRGYPISSPKLKICSSINVPTQLHILRTTENVKGKGKAFPLDAMEALGGRGGIAPTHSRPRH
jgi:hypothetical protein